MISPLLANAYLHGLDKLFYARSGPGTWANARLVRYCDDFVILARYIGPQMTRWLTGLLEERMGLSLNQEKTRVLDVQPGGDPMDFLGYTLRWERGGLRGPYPGLSLKPSRRSLHRFRGRVRELTAARWALLPPAVLIARLNPYLRGWANYFGRHHRGKLLNKADAFVYDRMVRHLKRRSQRGLRPPEGMSWYRLIHDRLGTVRLCSLRPAKAAR